MKRLTVLLMALIMTATSFAQTTETKPPVKKIEVNGSAEIEITPDEIWLNITLREYMKNKTQKVAITTLESQLQKAVEAAGIAKENFTIENVFGYNYDQWWKKKKTAEDFMARKQYRLKLNRLDKINGILAAVDEEGIESVNIASFSSSKMEEYRKQVKINALKAAKDKAEYLLSAIDEKIGNVIEIQEFNTDQYSDVRPQMANERMFKAAAADMGGAPDSNIDFKTIKVRAEVRAVFGIK
ncbi:SIMPL domain-containing protein [Chitinophaga sp. 22620]|uniref:SIMPL domain-containing protein n=1 Tax=Chitinophaga sp. 22620 TaxID=3453952 RepID=UPI003F83F157